MATLRHQIADRYLDVPLSFHREHTTGTLLAHADNDVMVAAEVINPLPFSTGLMLLIVFSLIALFAIDPLLTLGRSRAVPGDVRAEPLLHAPGRAARADGAGAGRRRLGDHARELRRRAGREDARAPGRRGRAAGATPPTSCAWRGSRVGALRALFEPTLDALPNLGIIALLAVGGWRVSTGAVSPGRARAGDGAVHAARVPDARRRLPARGDAAFGRRARSHRPRARGVARTDARRTRMRSRTDRSTSKPTGSSTGTSPERPVLQDCDVRDRARRGRRARRPDRLRQDARCASCSRASTGPTRASVRVGGVDLTEVTPRRAAGERRARVPGVVPVRRHDRQEHHARHRGERDVAAVGGADRAGGAVRRRAARGLRHGDRRAGRDAVGRPAAARRARPRARPPPAACCLDDATSAVDPTVEARILRGLRDELDMTTLIVAHRVSTIALADRVLFLQDGRIAATGTAHRAARDEPRLRSHGARLRAGGRADGPHRRRHASTAPRTT